jgi:ribonuclease VapC
VSDGRRVVLDASALLDWVMNERGRQTVDRLLAVSVIPASAMVEVLYRAAEKGHRLSPDQLHASLLEMGVEVEDVTAADVGRAGELIAASRLDPLKGSLSLGDGLCIAVAERLQLTVTGGDQYWANVDMTVPFLPFR